MDVGLDGSILSQDTLQILDEMQVEHLIDPFLASSPPPAMEDYVSETPLPSLTDEDATIHNSLFTPPSSPYCDTDMMDGDEDTVRLSSPMQPHSSSPPPSPKPDLLPKYWPSGVRRFPDLPPQISLRYPFAGFTQHPIMPDIICAVECGDSNEDDFVYDIIHGPPLLQ